MVTKDSSRKHEAGHAGRSVSKGKAGRSNSKARKASKRIPDWKKTVLAGQDFLDRRNFEFQQHKDKVFRLSLSTANFFKL